MAVRPFAIGYDPPYPGKPGFNPGNTTDDILKQIAKDMHAIRQAVAFDTVMQPIVFGTQWLPGNNPGEIAQVPIYLPYNAIINCLQGQQGINMFFGPTRGNNADLVFLPPGNPERLPIATRSDNAVSFTPVNDGHQIQGIIYLCLMRN